MLGQPALLGSVALGSVRGCHLGFFFVCFLFLFVSFWFFLCGNCMLCVLQCWRQGAILGCAATCNPKALCQACNPGQHPFLCHAASWCQACCSSVGHGLQGCIPTEIYLQCTFGGGPRQLRLAAWADACFVPHSLQSEQSQALAGFCSCSGSGGAGWAAGGSRGRSPTGCAASPRIGAGSPATAATAGFAGHCPGKLCWHGPPAACCMQGQYL
jgi:hypothetical protein